MKYSFEAIETDNMGASQAGLAHTLVAMELLEVARRQVGIAVDE